MMPKLKEELRTIFNDYGLKYVFDTNSQEIKVMKEKKPGEIFLIPFHSIADTLQRMIFYKAAIESNSESALVFEEPEAHSYPPFISQGNAGYYPIGQKPVFYNDTQSLCG